jgi:hypothetical protein
LNQHLFVERNSAVLVAGFFCLHGCDEQLLNTASSLILGSAQRANLGGRGRLLEAIEVKEKLASDGINDGAIATKGHTRSGADERCLLKRVRDARYSLHGGDGVTNGGGGYVFFTQRAQRPQLPEILKAVGLALGDEPCSFPPLQLAGADLQDPQHILAAKAGHSSMLRCCRPGRTQASNWVEKFDSRFCSCTWLSDQRRRNRSFTQTLRARNRSITCRSLFTAWIMPRICVNKQGRNTVALKSAWITGT